MHYITGYLIVFKCSTAISWLNRLIDRLIERLTVHGDILLCKLNIPAKVQIKSKKMSRKAIYCIKVSSWYSCPLGNRQALGKMCLVSIRGQ